MAEFFELYRKKGVLETLESLSKFKNMEVEQVEFFKNIKDKESNVNRFFRVKEDLLRWNLISYKLNDEYEKVIYLTEKGKKLYKKIISIEKLLKESIE